MIVKTTYKDQIVEHIYELMLDGVYSPGDQLNLRLYFCFCFECGHIIYSTVLRDSIIRVLMF